MTIAQARQQLNDPDPDVRRQALEVLVAAWRAGDLTCAPQRQAVNLHAHTIFSYNGYGHSPSSLAWLARESGWYALATVDFDVLDGVEETLAALDLVELRGGAGLETRVYVPEFAAWETNSPGEPGVMYHIGVGFASGVVPPEAAATLTDMRRRAAERNREMVARINAHLAPVEIDYARDVLPLTPSGNATERHILIAYDAAARRRYPRRGDLLAFWADRLGVAAGAVDALLGPEPAPHDLIRGKLMKRGGVGYMQPDADTFPRFVDVNAMLLASGAIPLYGLVDGLSPGERRLEEMLAFLMAQGIAGLNIVPDRNWNLPDPDERAIKVRRLHEIMALARDLDLPVLAGTEMNKAGQRLIDDFGAEPLRPYLADFLRGADWLHGHTVFQRAHGAGYNSAWAQVHLPDQRQRNAFYVRVGRAVAPGPGPRARLAQMNLAAGPEALLARLGA